VAREALVLLRADARSCTLVGHALSAFRQGEEKAVHAYLRSLRLDPGCADAALGLAELRLAQHRREASDESKAQLRAVVPPLTSIGSRPPRRAVLHCVLAQVLAVLGDRAQAVEHFHHALAINPHCADAKEGVEALDTRSKEDEPSSSTMTHDVD